MITRIYGTFVVTLDLSTEFKGWGVQGLQEHIYVLVGCHHLRGCVLYLVFSFEFLLLSISLPLGITIMIFS